MRVCLHQKPSLHSGAGRTRQPAHCRQRIYHRRPYSQPISRLSGLRTCRCSRGHRCQRLRRTVVEAVLAGLRYASPGMSSSGCVQRSRMCTLCRLRSPGCARTLRIARGRRRPTGRKDEQRHDIREVLGVCVVHVCSGLSLVDPNGQMQRRSHRRHQHYAMRFFMLNGCTFIL
jgi:hypothetical protein